MLPELGQVALILALLVALLQAVLPLAGAQRGISHWMALARPAAYLQWRWSLLAFAILTHAFVTQDFSLRYVATNSNSLLPVMYRYSAVWGAHEGSLLLWALILAAWTAAGGALFAIAAANGGRAGAGRDGAGQRRLPRLPDLHLQSVRAPAARRRRRPRPQPAAAGPGHDHPSADAVHRLRRLRGAVRVRDRGLARRQGRCALAALDAAVDQRRLGLPHHRHRAGHLGGRTTNSAGAAGGSGIRSRTPVSCPGWSARRCCIRRR